MSRENYQVWWFFFDKPQDVVEILWIALWKSAAAVSAQPKGNKTKMLET
jgi:hypothetical protein